MEVSATAIIPGRITSTGKIIFGTAAINGVRRAALMFLAAIARCTTRKLVHQYPNESTNPSPKTIANQSTPIGLADGPPSKGFQALVQASAAYAFVPRLKAAGSWATVCKDEFIAPQPPTSLRPR